MNINNSSKFCINCEIEFQPGENNNGDFCSDECADAFIKGADPELVSRSANTNPDALPITQDSWNRSPRTNSGHLPPSTPEAIASMLKIGGVSQADIDKVLQTKSSNESTPK